MTCEHRYLPMPGSVRRLYCERCGEGRDLEALPEVPRGTKPPVKRPPKPRRPAQPALPFGAGLPIGGDVSPISGDRRTPTAAELLELERLFGNGARPFSEASAIDEMAERMGLHRVQQGDPPGTYRPGESEEQPWKAP